MVHERANGIKVPSQHQPSSMCEALGISRGGAWVTRPPNPEWLANEEGAGKLPGETGPLARRVWKDRCCPKGYRTTTSDRAIDAAHTISPEKRNTFATLRSPRIVAAYAARQWPWLTALYLLVGKSCKSEFGGAQGTDSSLSGSAGLDLRGQVSFGPVSWL
jgi:hypothetical protein